jgi:hypothetical protein
MVEMYHMRMAILLIDLHPSPCIIKPSLLD